MKSRHVRKKDMTWKTDMCKDTPVRAKKLFQIGEIRLREDESISGKSRA
jgi:hypothetical protein